MDYFLGIDLGTSYFKAGIFDSDGTLVGLGRKPVQKDIRDGGRIELSVSTFWDTLKNCVTEAIQNARISAGEIKTISYSSQANSFILLDEQDEPLTPFVLWTDERAKDTIEELLKQFDKDEFVSKTGLGIGLEPGFLLPKIHWFQQKQPAIWAKTASVLTISDYLTFMLTGQKVADTSTFSMTGFYDIPNQRLWNKALDILSLKPELFPLLKRMGSFVGPVTESGAKQIGIASGTGCSLGGLDHHCAAIGSGILYDNIISESTGTVLACVGSSDKYVPVENCCTAPGFYDGQFFQLAYNNNGALSLEWYQKSFASDYSIVELLKMAETISEDCDGLFAKPCVNTYRELDGFEYRNPGYKHGHYVRAILKSTANSLKDLVDMINSDDFTGKVVSTGGGARSHLWIKIKANKLNVEFLIPECSEAACLGAALIGACNSGKNKRNVEWLNKWIRYSKSIHPC